MDDRKDFLRINDCSQELNRGVDEFGLQETQHSAKFGGSVSPNDFRIERLDVKRNSKEIKSHLEKSMVEQRIMLEESVLMQKHNVTFRTKPKQGINPPISFSYLIRVCRISEKRKITTPLDNKSSIREKSEKLHSILWSSQRTKSFSLSSI